MSDSELVVVSAQTFSVPILIERAGSSTRKHMAAIWMLFSWLTEKGVLAMNPAREVKTERFSRTEGKTPAFVEGEMQKLLGAIETSTHTGLRDRALLGVLAYTFARIGAVVNLKVEDYYPSGKRFLLRFKEKGGKEKELMIFGSSTLGSLTSVPSASASGAHASIRKTVPWGTSSWQSD
jgi:site-specific recombinase XerD